MNRTYFVNPKSPFIIFFPRREEYLTFKNEYDVAEGFGIIKSKHKDKHGNTVYWLFTSSHYYRSRIFFDKSTHIPKGLYILSCDVMYQAMTLNAALKAVRVRGITSQYACLTGNTQPTIYDNGASRFFSYIDSYFDGQELIFEEDDDPTTPDTDENAGYIDFIETYSAITEAEEEYTKENLFSGEYLTVDSACSHTSDGVIYRFKLKDNGTYPKNKSQVSVSTNDNSPPIKATVHSYVAPWLHLRFKSNTDSYTRFAASGEIKELINVEYRLKKKALSELKNDTCTNKSLLDIIVGKKLRPLTISEKYSPPKENGGDNVSVNGSQTDAIEKALNTEDFLLVQGPPGTGKTTIITEMVKKFIKDGKKILICSKSNLPVDNVIEKCLDLYYDENKTKKMLTLRLGHEDKVIASVKGQTRRPLALSIEADIKARSENARDARLAADDAVIRMCNDAQIETAPLGELITFFEAQGDIFADARQKLSKTIGGIFFSILLGIRKSGDMKKKLAKASALSDDVVSRIDELMKYEKSAVSKEYTDIAASRVRELFDSIALVSCELASAPKRYRGALGSLYDRVVSAAADHEAKKEKYSNITANTLCSYKGNVAHETFISTSNSREPDSSTHIYQYFTETLRQKKKKAEESKILFKSILDEWHEELLCDQQILEDPLVKCVKIVGATCIGVELDPAFTDAEYDVAIVDEAGQITVLDLIVPLVKAKKVILIGDHVQLPPMGKDDFCKHVKANDLFDFDGSSTVDDIKELMQTYTVSLFEKLFRDPTLNQNKVMLDTQYRMHPVIAEFISENFYGGKYKSGVSAEKRTLSIGGFTKPLYFIDTADSPDKHEYDPDHEADAEEKSADPDVPVSEEEEKKNLTNRFEAQTLADYIVRVIVDIENGTFTGSAKSLKNESGDYDIGVITAYKNQIAVIENCIREKLLSYYGDSGDSGNSYVKEILSHLTVNTLDSFQGRDNQIIFYSFVRSNPKHKIGFLNELRRINVMMTRAKSLLVMIGDSKTLTSSGYRAVHDGSSTDEFYKKLIDYCRENDGYIAL